MDLWTWIAKLVIEHMQDRFNRQEERAQRLYDLARRAHDDQGACPGGDSCKFCQRLTDAMTL